jgi:hypothetical protein
MVQSQLRQIVYHTLARKSPSIKKRAGGLAQDVGPEFKPQYHTQKRIAFHIIVPLPSANQGERP